MLDLRILFIVILFLMLCKYLVRHYNTGRHQCLLVSTQRWHWIWAVHLLANFFFKIALDKYYFPNNGRILLVSDECQNCAKNFTFWYHTSGDLLSKIWYQKFWHTFGTHLICRRILPLMIFQISAKIDDFFIFFKKTIL